MGIEFFAELDSSGDYAQAAIDAVRADGRYVIESELLDSSVSLRLSANPRRTAWPEDAQVTFGPRKIYVVFHAASRDDRLHLLGVVEAALAKRGRAVTFIED